MATQLGERPSRVERRDTSELNSPSKIERVGEKIGGDKNPVNQITNAKNVAKNITKKPITLNFICMLAVSIILDLLSLIPAISILISILYNVIFIPWFFFSGVKFNMKKIGSMGATSILEYIPFISFLPFMTLNVIYSYYSN